MPDHLKILAPFAKKAALALIIIISALVISGAFQRLIHSLRNSNHLAPIMARRLQKFQRWTIFLVAGLILLQALGVFGSAWGLISAGLAALAVGFVAAWSMLSNATAALLILTFRPFRIGDMVELVEPNGAALGGHVADMNLMYTTLKLEPVAGEAAVAPRFLCVPNNLFFQKMLRTQSLHKGDGKAAFFPGQDD